MQRIYNIREIIKKVIINNPYQKGKLHFEKLLLMELEGWMRKSFLLKVNKRFRRYGNKCVGLYNCKNDVYIKRMEYFCQLLIQEWWMHFCPYCGKTPIIYYDTKGWFKRLYDMEHFLPKSIYPTLSVNFYNLLPVCIACNQRIKRVNDPSKKKEIFHPYFWFNYSNTWSRNNNSSFDSRFTFIQNDGTKRRYIFQSEHAQFFDLWNIYLHASDTFRDFHFIYGIYSKIKLEHNSFKIFDYSFEKRIKYFLKWYYPEKESEILSFSNGKFKKDLIEYMQKVLEKNLHNKDSL